MKPLAILFFAASAAVMVAQAPTHKPPTFHLPAGDYTVPQLIAQAEQAVRGRIATEHVDLTAPAPLHLQQDLALSAQDWEDTLSALLSTRDLVLTFDAEQKRHEVLPTPKGKDPVLKARAAALSLAQFATRPGMTGPVRVVLPTKTDAVMLDQFVALPLFKSGRGVFVESDAGGVAVTGLAETVRLAMRHAAMLDPTLADTSTSPAPAWPRAVPVETNTLAAGDHAVREVVDILAKAISVNLVLSPEVAQMTDSVAVAKPITGDAIAFENAVTALLWEQRHLLVLPLGARADLLEVVHLGDREFPATTRARPMSAAELAARPGLVAWVSTSFVPQHLRGNDLATAMREAVRALGVATTSLLVNTTHDGLVFTGLSTECAAAIATVRDRDEKIDPAK